MTERKLATIQRIEEIQPIEGADKIEKVRIKEWWCVTEKGNFQVGSLCAYFEIDSLLPSSNPAFSFLAKGNKEKTMNLDGKEYKGYRLKTIRLRGQISQGLALPIAIVLKDVLPPFHIGSDFSDHLGIVKYEPPIPASLSGKVKGNFPSFIPKTDEERIQNMPEILGNFYVVTEKLDGSSVTYFKKDGVFGVCSRNLELLEGETTQWRIAKELDLQNKIPDNFALQGEIVGEGIQKNPLRIKGQHVYFYNAYNISSGIYLNFKDFTGLCDFLSLETVPILDENFSLPGNVSDILLYAEGKSMFCVDAEREGIVVRPKVEMKYNGERLSFKCISNKYLLENE